MQVYDSREAQAEHDRDAAAAKRLAAMKRFREAFDAFQPHLAEAIEVLGDDLLTKQMTRWLGATRTRKSQGEPGADITRNRAVRRVCEEITKHGRRRRRRTEDNK